MAQVNHDVFVVCLVVISGAVLIETKKETRLDAFVAILTPSSLLPRLPPPLRKRRFARRGAARRIWRNYQLEKVPADEIKAALGVCLR